MSDPAIAADGQAYERAAITGWRAAACDGPCRSPVIGLPLEHMHLPGAQQDCSVTDGTLLTMLEPDWLNRSSVLTPI